MNAIESWPWYWVAILGVTLGLFLAWVASRRDQRVPGYSGHNPAVPKGWRLLKTGEAVMTSLDDKVWGFDAWYPVLLDGYEVRGGEGIFIRPLPHVPLDDPFRRSPKAPGAEDKAGNDPGYPSLL